MALVLFLTCLLLALLLGEGWLLFQLLSQQGRLLLRLEAVEVRQSQAGLAPQAGGPAPARLEVGTLAQHNGNGAQAKPRPSAPAIGDPAPDFSLPSLEGKQVKLSDFRGHKTLVLFWRPSCAFCQRMLPDLQAWEAQPPEEAPRLLMVSSESVADNQALGLRSPIVLDHTVMSVGNQFGATGTPMAVLVDEEGKIASALTGGRPSVLALARGVQETKVPPISF